MIGQDYAALRQEKTDIEEKIARGVWVSPDEMTRLAQIEDTLKFEPDMPAPAPATSGIGVGVLVLLGAGALVALTILRRRR